MTMTMHPKTRLPSLDGLRAFSIALVCIGHVAGTVGAPEFLTPLHNLGNFGVKIFFVISGFLITYLLLIEHEKNGRIDMKQFYIRRTFRLFPAFYTFIACMAAAHYLGWIELWEGDLFHAATYTMNYHHERSWWLNHTWSLAVEEQFYLIWPLLLLLIGRVKAKHVAIFVVCFVPLIRAVMWFVFDASESAMTREFQAVADALATGCILAYFYKEGVQTPQWMRGVVFYIIPITMFAVPFVMMKIDPALFYIAGQSVVNICAAVMIWRFLHVREGVPYILLNCRLAMWIGTLSYSLYLWQEPFLNSWVRDWYAAFPLNIFLTFIFALISYYGVEKPFLKLRQYFTKAEKKPSKFSGRKFDLQKPRTTRKI